MKDMSMIRILAAIAAILHGVQGILTPKTGLCDPGGPCSCDLTWGKISCSCGPQHKEVVLSQELLPQGTSSVRVDKCARVRVAAKTWESHHGMRRVDLSNIGELRLESYGFSWNFSGPSVLPQDPFPQPGLVVNIANCSIPELPSYTFRGRLASISFRKVHIEYVRAFAFGSLLGMAKLELADCTFSSVEGQAFKKFSTENLHITGGQFLKMLPSRMMMDLEVYHELLIEGVTSNPGINSAAFMIHGPKLFRLRNCNFGYVAGEAFKVKTRGQTLIQNNVFLKLSTGVFLKVTLDRLVLKYESTPELRFENNTIHDFDKGAMFFDTNSFEPQLDKIHIEKACSCSSLEQWNSMLGTNPPATFLQQKEKTQGSTQKPSSRSPFWCLGDDNKKRQKQYIRFSEFSTLHCDSVSSNSMFLIIIISCCIAVLVLISLAIFLFCRCHSKNRTRWINVPTSPNSEIDRTKANNKGKFIPKEVAQPNGDTPRLPIIVPDGRTYRETELHVIVERTEPLLEHDL